VKVLTPEKRGYLFERDWLGNRHDRPSTRIRAQQLTKLVPKVLTNGHVTSAEHDDHRFVTSGARHPFLHAFGEASAQANARRGQHLR
jgi:hypothetical protein